jgi:hypothetical protein
LIAASHIHHTKDHIARLSSSSADLLAPHLLGCHT